MWNACNRSFYASLESAMWCYSVRGIGFKKIPIRHAQTRLCHMLSKKFSWKTHALTCKFKSTEKRKRTGTYYWFNRSCTAVGLLLNQFFFSFFFSFYSSLYSFSFLCSWDPSCKTGAETVARLRVVNETCRTFHFLVCLFFLILFCRWEAWPFIWAIANNFQEGFSIVLPSFNIVHNPSSA